MVAIETYLDLQSLFVNKRYDRQWVNGMLDVAKDGHEYVQHPGAECFETPRSSAMGRNR